MQMSIPKYIYSRTVLLCKSYYSLCNRLREIERDIILSSAPPGDGMPRGNSTGDPTARRAERIIAAQAETMRQKQAIDEAFDELDETGQTVVRLNLFERLPLYTLDVDLSERQMKRIRRGFVLRVAEKLGENYTVNSL